jgi:two-component system chemotaxis response regulator CheY
MEEYERRGIVNRKNCKGVVNMKTLVVEDDFISRLVMQQLLSPYGECHVAIDGAESIKAFKLAKEEKKPYNLICLDIMMPGMNGHDALKIIRSLEKKEGILLGMGVKVIMTTALKNKENVFSAFNEFCDAYIVKPIDKNVLLDHLRTFGLIDK